MTYTLSQALTPRGRFLSDAGRTMGLAVCSPKGSGKSRLIGRQLAFSDFRRGLTTVILDPMGGTLDNFLDQVLRQPPAVQAALIPRLRYLDMAGTSGRVVPLPIVARTYPQERLYSVSQHFFTVLKRADAALERAPILGWNPLHRYGTAALICLAALGLGITGAESLITDPLAWEPRLQEAVRRHPDEATLAAEDLRELGRLPAREHEARTSSLRGKLAMVRHDRISRALYGGTTPGFTWEEADAKRLGILVDFRGLLSDPTRLQFAVLWVFISILDFIRRRSNDKSQRPFSLVWDELSAVVGAGSLNAELLTADFEELLNRLARNRNVWVSLCLQEQHQLPESLRNTVLSMGNLILGGTSDRDASLRLARRFYRFNPLMVKKTTVPFDRAGRPEPWNARTTEYTASEQDLLNAYCFHELPKFTFLVAASLTEGTLPTRLERISTASVDAGEYVREEEVADFRARLSQAHGIPIQTLLQDIEKQQQQNTPLNSREHRSTMNRPTVETTPVYDTDDDLPAYEVRQATVPADRRGADRVD